MAAERFHLQLPGGSAVPYLLTRSARRRSVGLRISTEGLIVQAPMRLSRTVLEGMLLAKSRWIVSKLAVQQAQPAPFSWQDGAQLILLGNPVTLSLIQDARNHAPAYAGGVLSIAQPDIADSRQVARKVLLWYQRQATADFSRRLALLAAKLGVATPPLFLSNARSRWGSCNSRGEIRLNWRLIQASPHIVQYVAAHEMAHLKEMNHSPRFWRWVEQLCPDYRQAEKDLKQISVQLHLLK